MPFLDLPDEIIVKILCHLDPSDINNLYEFASIRNRFQQFISLTIDDENSINFPNIPIESKIIINKDSNINCAGLLEFFEVNNFTDFNKKFSQIKDQVPKFCIINDPIKWLHLSPFEFQYKRGDDLVLFNQLINEASKNSSAIKYLSFINLTKIVIENINIDPSIHLPNLESTIITNCKSSNESIKFKWNKLKDLSITGPNFAESLHKSIDYNLYPIRLYLTNIGHLRFTNLIFTNLRFILITSDPSIEGFQLNDIITIDNCVFPNLKELNIGVQNGVILENVTLPNLLKLSIKCTSGQIILNNVISNNLEVVEITTSVMPLIQKFQCLSLQLIYFDIEIFREDADFNFLTNIPNLIIKNHVSQILSKINLECLKFLGLDLIQPNDLAINSMEFPQLEYADLSLDFNYDKIPLINAPNLKQLNIADSPGLNTLNNIPIDYPQLEELILEMVQLPLKVKDITFPNLISFEINMEGDLLEFINCDFPKLKSFFAIGSMFETPSSIMINAENLVEMKLENLDMEELILPNNPKLQHLSANRVESLYTQDLDSLICLDLSYNLMKDLNIKSAPNLKNFESIQSNAQEFKFESGLNLSSDEKFIKFGSRYNPVLESISIEEPIGVRSWMAKYYWDLNKALRR
ncbi:hypothetical protein BN7_4160 [Wickerhamomyces ciferrii]|uniref:F-box domain-containing protein n=1 Tax=Wickerhamomyces ciferrii (strain ATCC 14091 / BCRC 22168 / CBS 111 / JCM 3599 / NBRC 0793 / NRRL Y-1031 F-60-10) TaxID=1206466 RepID=K0KTI7_WICCF|nr:uncharacterized protein BN7_4160 [Wickerhamomyces ciferrii]CCH44593.1 hypothetical protein BN7_4160 [Wickerhamomyces ciferrii]